MFKHKKIVSIILCIGIATSSFGGIITTYAQNDNNKEMDNLTVKSPEQNITELLPEVNKQEIATSKNEILSNNDGDYILYQGTRTRYNSEGSKTYKFSISEEDIDSLLESGFTIQDIFEADEISNEIFIDPMELLDMKKETDKSLLELKDDVIKERKDYSISYLKNKHGKDIDTLQGEGLNEDEIVSLLISLDSSGLQLNDDLIKEYKSKDSDVDQLEIKKGISEATKKKYGISDKDAEKLTEELILMFEKVSEDTNKSVKELIKSYFKSFKN